MNADASQSGGRPRTDLAARGIGLLSSHTDVAKASMIGMPNAVRHLAEDMDVFGFTAIFEWCSPRNRIVVRLKPVRHVIGHP
ncbi:MAG: hypothetical protein V4502_01120, partial [Pseudomonadota bacterium]